MVEQRRDAVLTTEREVIAVLREIVDPHTNVNVYDMGLISDLEVKTKNISLTFRPTSPFCPLSIHLTMNIKRRLLELKGITDVDVRVAGHLKEDLINRALKDA